MKLLSKLSIFAAAVALSVSAYAITIPLGGSIFPLTYISQSPINLTDGFNEMLALVNAQTVGISTQYSGAATIPSAGVDTSGVTFSTNLQGNPLVQVTYQSFLTASANAAGGVTILASETGRKIGPVQPISLMVSGTAAGATAEVIRCSSGPILESFPIATLVNNVPAVTSSGIAFFSAFEVGCPSGDSILLSNSGAALTTTTQIFVNLPYSVQ